MEVFTEGGFEVRRVAKIQRGSRRRRAGALSHAVKPLHDWFGHESELATHHRELATLRVSGERRRGMPDWWWGHRRSLGPTSSAQHNSGSLGIISRFESATTRHVYEYRVDCARQPALYRHVRMGHLELELAGLLLLCVSLHEDSFTCCETNPSESPSVSLHRSSGSALRRYGIVQMSTDWFPCALKPVSEAHGMMLMPAGIEGDDDSSLKKG
ncbi:hypothetical protein EI94DRAFT_1788879 [Lactarius quietus]|nr:hypothetical protein EI94DRAFT_1788879 [Lactarius quietus]